jgi:hypothetical protein
MAKGRGGRRREAKKPRGGNKPLQTGTGFLPVQQATTKALIKESNK